jgi:signal peptidase II
MLKSKSVISFLGYSCIIGGAIGNVIDRVFRGAVFDFIYFHYQDYGFPIFNLADSFISLGVIILIYDYWCQKKSIEEKAKRNYDVLEVEAERIRKLSDITTIKVR